MSGPARTATAGGSSLEAFGKSHTGRVEAKPGGEGRQGIDPPRHIGRLVPSVLIHDSERSGEIFERVPQVASVLGGMKRDVERARRNTKNLDVDPRHAQRVRIRGQLLPHGVGRSGDPDQRAMKVNDGGVAASPPCLGVAMPRIPERAKSELPKDGAGVPIGPGGHQQIGVRVGASSAVSV